MPKSLKNSAQEVAKEYGFSSLQDLMRVILTKLSRRELVVSINETSTLSQKNNARYVNMSKDFAKKQNTKSFSSAEELMSDLRS